MFHPNDNPLDRGWVGRIDGDRMLHLAAQTLQSFFLGRRRLAGACGVSARRRHPARARAVPADGAALRRGRLVPRSPTRPPSSGRTSPVAGTHLSALARIAVVIGAGGEIGGTTAMRRVARSCRAARRQAVRLRNRARPGGRDARRDRPGLARLPAERGRANRRGSTGGVLLGRGDRAGGHRTTLRPGDVIAGPPVVVLDGVDGRRRSSRSRASARSPARSR